MRKTTLIAGIACIGVVLTGVTAYKAGEKVWYKKNTQANMSKKDILTTYTPPAIVGLSTIGGIILLNKIHSNYELKLTNAYFAAAALATKYRDYAMTKDGSKSIEQIANDDFVYCGFEPTLGENMLFYDEFSGRFFETTPEIMTATTGLIDELLNSNNDIRLNDLYDYWGIPNKGMYYDIFYWDEDPEIRFENTLINDDLECIVVYFNNLPTM